MPPRSHRLVPQDVRNRSHLHSAVWALAAALLTGACAAPPSPGLKPPTRVDVAESAPISLRIEVRDFQWAYSGAGDRLLVTGRVKNDTGRPQPMVYLYAMLFDETGLAVGLGEALVSPAPLSAGAEGSFHLSVRTSRPRHGRQGPIEYLRLLTNARNE